MLINNKQQFLLRFFSRKIKILGEKMGKRVSIGD